MKISYYHNNAFEENKHDIKKSWSIMRPAIGKINDKSSYSPSFTINETPVTHRTLVAEGFNIFFSKIGLQTSKYFHHFVKNYKEFMPESILSMFIETVEQVYATANKLKSKLSHGHDDISTVIK